MWRTCPAPQSRTHGRRCQSSGLLGVFGRRSSFKGSEGGFKATGLRCPGPRSSPSPRSPTQGTPVLLTAAPAPYANDMWVCVRLQQVRAKARTALAPGKPTLTLLRWPQPPGQAPLLLAPTRPSRPRSEPASKSPVILRRPRGPGSYGTRADARPQAHDQCARCHTLQPQLKATRPLVLPPPHGRKARGT